MRSGVPGPPVPVTLSLEVSPYLFYVSGVLVLCEFHGLQNDAVVELIILVDQPVSQSCRRRYCPGQDHRKGAKLAHTQKSVEVIVRNRATGFYNDVRVDIDSGFDQLLKKTLDGFSTVEIGRIIIGVNFIKRLKRLEVINDHGELPPYDLCLHRTHDSPLVLKKFLTTPALASRSFFVSTYLLNARDRKT